MVFEAARRAARGLFAPHARAVLLKSLGLTVLLFFGVWLGLQSMASIWLLPFLDGWVWISGAVVWLLGAGVVVGAAFLLGPVTAIFAGIFLDDVAANIERHDYANDPPGRAMPMVPGVLLAIKFAIYVLLANLLALFLVWVAGFGVIIFFLVNAWLLGREYFQFASMRFRSESDARSLAGKYSLEIFLAGLIIAGFMAVPVLNLLTPMFAASLMVHLHKAISHRQPESPGP